MQFFPRFLLGDGGLAYGHEKIFECFYTAHLWRGFFASYDFQHINNPGYNQARGPVAVSAVRFHTEFRPSEAGCTRWRSTPVGIGSWRRRGNKGRFAASRPREKARTLVSGRFRVTEDGGRGLLPDGAEVGEEIELLAQLISVPYFFPLPGPRLPSSPSSSSLNSRTSLKSR